MLSETLLHTANIFDYNGAMEFMKIKANKLSKIKKTH